MALDVTPQPSTDDGDTLMHRIDELSRQTTLLALDTMLAAVSDKGVDSAEAAHRARVLSDRLAAGVRKTEARRSAG